VPERPWRRPSGPRDPHRQSKTSGPLRSLVEQGYALPAGCAAARPFRTGQEPENLVT
jgi:hypothetical protein